MASITIFTTVHDGVITTSAHASANPESVRDYLFSEIRDYCEDGCGLADANYNLSAQELIDLLESEGTPDKDYRLETVEIEEEV